MEDQNNSPLGNFIPPRDIIDAMTEIQQWSIMEKRGESLEKEFFTMKHFEEFSKIGIKSAFRDSMIWIIVYVVFSAAVYFAQSNYLKEGTTQVFIWTIDGSPVFWFSKLASFGGLAFSTIICILTARYYVGNVPKRAINTWFITRAMFLICFAFLTFFAMGVIYKFVLTDAFIDGFARSFAYVSTDLANRVHHFLVTYFRRSLFEAGIIAMLASFVSIIVPYIFVIIFKYTRKRDPLLGIGAN